MFREVSLEEILEAREQKAAAQKELIRKYRQPVLSFSLNIPGSRKRSELTDLAFDAGKDEILQSLQTGHVTVLESVVRREDTGCVLLLSAAEDAGILKDMMTQIEDHHALGRLFDMDVTDIDGKKLERSVQRSCIVCNRQGRMCASKRLHSLEELKRETENILGRGLVAEYATQALENEVYATPKPGLVDRNNSGSHKEIRDTTK